MHSIAWWPTLFVLAVATYTDLRSRRIPNWLVLPFLVAGVCVSGWQAGWHGILSRAFWAWDWGRYFSGFWLSWEGWVWGT